MTLPTCKTCPAFHNNQCRANPPTHDGWPSVQEFDFCTHHPAAQLVGSGLQLQYIGRAIEHLGNVWQEFQG